ncbi:hypothetical protein ACIBI9_56830 [Nonomuraea sp. NPDC050451]|uniref:hypothetical protein n=1 Tax=Nonomuraea sp. NPDC050451 TaxID=3364364 RepID=UPI00378EF082
MDDVSPVSGRDSTGTGIFYFLIVCSLAGYLATTVLAQAAPHLPLRTTYGILAGAAVIGPLIAFGIGSIFLGCYGASLAQIIGVAMAYTFLCGTIAILSHQLNHAGDEAVAGLGEVDLRRP